MPFGSGSRLARIRIALVIPAVWLAMALDGRLVAAAWPVPDDEARKVAAGEIADAYEPELAAARRGSKEHVATLLLTESEKTNVPARAFVMLEMAERLSVETSNVEQAMRVIDARSQLFETDKLAERVAALSLLLKSGPLEKSDRKRVLDGNVAAAITLAAITTTDQAIAADRLDLAVAALDLAKGLAKDAVTEPGLEERTKLIGDRRTQKILVEEALRAVETNPNDGAAHTTVGLDACFVRNDWGTGLVHLAKSSDVALKTMAENETRCRTLLVPVPEEGFALAGRWWNMAEEGAYSSHAEAMKRRARELYELVAEGLTDPVERRTALKRAAADVPAATQSSFPEPSSGSPTAKLPRGFEGRAKPAEWAAAYGGGADTEAAVDMALRWIVDHQLPDGGWSFDLNACPACRGKCSQSGAIKAKDRCGATAMALLPLLGRGYTHRQGKYKAAVDKGVAFLAQFASLEQGKLYRDNGNLYSQGLGASALCECYALTRDRRVLAPAQLAVAYLVAAQHPSGGGWRYTPRQPGDTSATGWQVVALKTATVAGITVNPLSLRKAGEFLDSVSSANGSRYGYTDNSRSSPGLTAVGLCCRLHLGWKKDHPAIKEGVEYLAGTGPTADLYFDYYATQVMRNVEGNAWVEWNEKMKKLLLSTQSKEGHEAGSWHSQVGGGPGADAAGRLYCTSLATLILEAYYRTIPL